MKWSTAILVIFALLSANATVSTTKVGNGYQNNALFAVEAESETEEFGITIVCTVDGNLHGIDKFGRRLWSGSFGEAMLAAHTGNLHKRRNYAVLPAVDGSLIYSSSDGMRKTRLSAKLLAEQSPFFSREGVSFTGTARTRTMSFDARTGDLLFDSEKKLRTVRRAEDAVPVWFGRVDYFVRAVDVFTGLEEFNVSYSELHPIPYDPSFGDLYAGLPSGEAEDVHDAGNARLASGYAPVPVVGTLGGTELDPADGDGDGDSIPISADTSAQVTIASRNPATTISGTTQAQTQAQGQGQGQGQGEQVPRGRAGARQRGGKRRRGSIISSGSSSSINAGGVAGGAGSGRRRRGKSRMRMEQRAGEVKYLRDRLVQAALAELDDEAALTALDPDAMAVISTPAGDLFFSDGAGAIVERVPVSLHSPVMHAFHLRRDLSPAIEAQRSLLADWAVRYIGVHHRILTHQATAPAQAAAVSPAGAVAVAPHSGIASTLGSAAEVEEVTVVVQAPSPLQPSALFALEVSELAVPALTAEDRDRMELWALRQALAEASTATAAAQPNQLLPYRGRGPQMAGVQDGATQRPALTGSVRHLARELLRDHTSGQPPRLGKRRRQGVNQHQLPQPARPQLLPGGDDDGSGLEITEHDDLDDLGGRSRSWEESLPSGSCVLPYSGESQQAGTLCLLPAPSALSVPAPAPSAALPAIIRGSHTLRADLYEGTLFHRDERAPFFSGMLHRNQAQTQGQAHAENLELYHAHTHILGGDGRSKAGSDHSHSAPQPPPPAHYDPRWRLSGLAARAMAAAQQLLVVLVALAIVAGVGLAGMVLLLRSHPAYQALFPPDQTLVEQVAVLAYSLLGGPALVPAAPSGSAAHHPKRAGVRRVRSSNTLQQLAGSGNDSTVKVSSVQHPGGIGGSGLTIEGATTQPNATSAPAPTAGAPAPAFTSAQASISAATAAADSPSVAAPQTVAAIEGRDAEGRRTLQVGTLIILPDCVLGYGSHGTVVYRGSLHGRPLAVKRVLSQFVKAADREISLLIRSDGHPNVVRYFTKEEHSDFVYLGLQLCDMTLKDFVEEASSRHRVKLREQAADPVSGDGSGCGGGEGASSAVAGRAVASQPVPITEEVRSSLLQVAAGLAHLHAQKIVHRDLKPHNILCCSPDQAGGADGHTEPSRKDSLGAYVLKISDMGLSRQLDRDHHSFSSASMRHGPAALAASLGMSIGMSRGMRPAAGGAGDEGEAVGTIGWQAPELVRHRYSAAAHQPHLPPSETAEDGTDESGLRRRTLTVDVFSLGCVFYFTLTLGGHPFGQWFEREANIAAGKVDLSGVVHEPLAADLLSWMLQPHPLRRPSSRQVCAHAFFWSAARRLDFLVEFSDRLEQELPDAAVVMALEARAAEITGGGNWHAKLDAELVSDLSRYRRYDTASVRDLLRVVRNKRHHYHELTPELKLAMGAIPEAFLRYFESRFPQLLLYCAAVAGHYLSKEATFHMCVGAVSPREQRAERAAQHNFHMTGTAAAAAGGEGNASNSREPVALQGEEQAEPLVTPGTGTAQAAAEAGGRGWWVSADSWARGAGSGTGAAEGPRKARAARLQKVAQDPKYRTRLCSQWEESGGAACSMRRKGRCDFAHGALELRAKESRRGKWGRALATAVAVSPAEALIFSGGENAFGEARLMEIGRKAGNGGGSAPQAQAQSQAQQQLQPATALGPPPAQTSRLQPQVAQQAAYPASYDHPVPQYGSSDPGAAASYGWQQGISPGAGAALAQGHYSAHQYSYSPHPQPHGELYEDGHHYGGAHQYPGGYPYSQQYHAQQYPAHQHQPQPQQRHFHHNHHQQQQQSWHGENY